MRRVFDVCHGCRRCFNLCQSFPTLFDMIDNSPSGELNSVPSSDFKKVQWLGFVRSKAHRLTRLVFSGCGRMHSLRHVFHQQVRPSRPRACSCSPRITRSQVPLHAASSTQRRLSPPYSALPCCRCKVPSPSVMYSALYLVHAIGFQRERQQPGCSAKLRRCYWIRRFFWQHGRQVHAPLRSLFHLRLL